ncbi:MAG: hypothetical protein ACE5Q5_04230, partial [Nitrosarchaeum sp.]
MFFKSKHIVFHSMRVELWMILVFSVVIFMISPVYGDVTSISLEKSSYTIDESFTFIGKESEGQKAVNVVIRGPTGEFKDILSTLPSDSDGSYTTFPKEVKAIFKSKGTYTATAFTDTQSEKSGVAIKLEFDGTKVFVASDFILSLNPIPDKIIEVKKTLVFTPTLTESLTGVVFSLEDAPSGASITEAGKFTWTPTETQGPGSYVFNIVVKKAASEDKKSVKITVTKPTPITQPNPEPEYIPEPEPELEPEYIPEPPPQELGIASFVDPTKDPQSYVDRYNNEPSYKKWFDTNFPEYSSIYDAVGLDEPKKVASFVDPTKDPQSYVDRYNNEPSYKKWFDTNFPEYSSIYDAVGLDEPKKVASFVDPTKDPQSYVDRYN